MAVMDELGSGSWCASAPGGACQVSGHQYFSLAAVKIDHMCDRPVCKFIDRVCKEGVMEPGSEGEVGEERAGMGRACF